MYLDILRYISVFKTYISSFVPWIALSFRMITHSLSWGGKGMKGYDALYCTMISRRKKSRGSAGARLGRYNELCFLPDKAARVLFEFHTEDYMRLPAIPSSTSSGDIHKLFKTHHVCIYKNICFVDTGVLRAPSGIGSGKAACRTSWRNRNDSILHGGFCRRCIRYKRGGRWRKQVVLFQHVALELVARTRREMNKLSFLFCIF